MPDLPRHDCKYSDGVTLQLCKLLGSEAEPVEGLLCDPFAGVRGLSLTGRTDWYGIEIEPEWAAAHSKIRQGDALDRSSYDPDTKTIVTSPVYPNRMTGGFLGTKCTECDGHGWVEITPPMGEHGDRERESCDACGGSGRDASGRFGYAISLGRRPSGRSSALHGWGEKYRDFHRHWLAVCAAVVPPGPRRLFINMSDHYADKKRVHVCAWWIAAARLQGFDFVESWPVETPRFGMGRNAQSRAEREQILVFDRRSN